MGEFVVELYWKHAPMTCRNFAELARRGYYNDTKFHRIIKDFMIQGMIFFRGVLLSKMNPKGNYLQVVTLLQLAEEA